MKRILAVRVAHFLKKKKKKERKEEEEEEEEEEKIALRFFGKSSWGKPSFFFCLKPYFQYDTIHTS